MTEKRQGTERYGEGLVRSTIDPAAAARADEPFRTSRDSSRRVGSEMQHVPAQSRALHDRSMWEGTSGSSSSRVKIKNETGGGGSRRK